MAIYEDHMREARVTEAICGRNSDEHLNALMVANHAYVRAVVAQDRIRRTEDAITKARKGIR